MYSTDLRKYFRTKVLSYFRKYESTFESTFVPYFRTKYESTFVLPYEGTKVPSKVRKYGSTFESTKVTSKVHVYTSGNRIIIFESPSKVQYVRKYCTKVRK